MNKAIEDKLNKLLPNKLPDLDGGAYALQELSECIKWLAELQIYQGNKESTDFYNSEDTCGSWYAAKITQTIAEKMVLITENMIREELDKV